MFKKKINGINVVNKEKWKSLLKNLDFIPVDYTYESLNYHLENNKHQNPDLKLELLEILNDNKPIGVLPIYNNQSSSFNGINFKPPIFFNTIPRSIENKINKKIVENLTRYLEENKKKITIVEKTYFIHRPSNFIENFLLPTCKVTIEFDLYIDLTNSISDIKSNFRKSYKSLINSKTNKNLEIKILDEKNITKDEWENFKYFHNSLPDKINRPDLTWEIQYERILNKSALLIYANDLKKNFLGGSYVAFSRDEANYGSSIIINNSNLNIGHIFQFEIIKYLKDKNIKMYNLGKSYFNSESEKLQKISNFKSGFSSNINPRYLLHFGQ